MSTAFTNPAMLRRLQLLGQQAAPDDMIGQDGTVRRRLQLTAPTQDYAPVERAAPQGDAPVASSPVARISMPPQTDAPLAPRAGVSAFLQPERLDRSPSMASSPPVINGTPARMIDRPPADMSGAANFARITAPPRTDVDASRQAMQRGQALRLTVPEDNNRAAMGRAINAPPFERVMNQAVALQPPVDAQRVMPTDAERAAYGPGPAQERAMQMLAQGASQHHGAGGFKGFVEHIKDGAKLAGKAFVASGGNPYAAMVGGVAGAVDPQLEHDFDFASRVRHSLGEANAEAGLQQEDLNRARQYEQGSGTNFYTGQRTLQGQHYDDLADKYAAASDATRRRLDQGDQKQEAVEKNQRISRMLSAARIPGRTFDPQSKAELEKEIGARLPDDFNPITHDVIKTDKGYRIVSFPKAGGAASLSPPIAQPAPPRAVKSNAPHWAYQGRARTELQKERGITDAGALVDNPAFADAFEQKKAAEQQSSQANHYPMPSDAEITAIVSKKVPRKVKAGSLITPDMVNERAAQIYDRERGNKGNTPSRPTGRAAQQQMAAHESEYQRLYPKLSPEDRKTLEDSFQRDYGRLPRKP